MNYWAVIKCNCLDKFSKELHSAFYISLFLKYLSF
jgi:hypothetical protein